MFTTQGQPGLPIDAPDNPSQFRLRHRSLVWSNSNASDTVFLRQALLQPRFTVLLDAALAFGMERLNTEWQILLADDGEEVRRAAPVTQRMLKNIQHGYEQATA